MYVPDQVEACVKQYLDGVERDHLEPIPNQCVAMYQSDLDEDAQVAFGVQMCRLGTSLEYPEC